MCPSCLRQCGAPACGKPCRSAVQFAHPRLPVCSGARCSERLPRETRSPVLRPPWLDTVLLDLPRNEVTKRNVRLLILGVTREIDDLHRSRKRLRYRIEHVRSADKEHLGQVERTIQVVIPESIVLLRIERFRRADAGSPRKSRPSLIDLVQHEDGIVSFRPAQRLNDLPRQRTQCRYGDGRESRPRRACRPARYAGTCVPEHAPMLRPSEVFPTPGGPTKQRIGPFISGFRRRTLR